MPDSRKNTTYLVGPMNNQILGSKLPSKRDVLRVLYFNLRMVNLNFCDSASLVVDEVFVFWAKARIPTQNRSNSINKLKGLYENLRQIEKTKGRDTKAQRQKEMAFQESLNDLFDIATSNALDVIKIAEDREFLILQRQKNRPGCMLGIDFKLLKTEKRKSDRFAAETRRKEKATSEEFTCAAAEDLPFCSDSEDFEENIDENITEMTSISIAGPSTNKRARKELITPRLAAALDKCKLSDRNSVHILTACVEALSLNPSEFIINRTSIKRLREKFREEKYLSIKSKEINSNFVVLHWDTKLLPDISAHKLVDRLPVIATAVDLEQLLGVPSINSSQGVEVSSAVYDALEDWGLIDTVQAFCFDTTASNTGRFKGSAVLLEQTLGRDILWLPCRHHIFEVVLAGVFLSTKVSAISGPNIPLFKRFKQKWETFDKTKYLDFTTDTTVYESLKNGAADIISFAKQKLEEAQPRDDYKEFLQLTLIFLGEKTNICFRSPGAFSLARWMAKGIYCLKIFIFREQFMLKPAERKSINKIWFFLIFCYIRAWFSAPNTLQAPFNDINFLKTLNEFSKVNEEMSSVASKKFVNHLWYLTQECAAFSIFDKRIDVDTKKRMVKKLMSTDNSDNEDDTELEISKKILINVKNIPEFISKDLPTELLTPNSLNLFRRFGINIEFLKTDPSLCELREDYLEGKKIISALKSVNDCAERGVKLIDEYNDKITRNEQQKQFLLQVVQSYRQKYPTVKKEDMCRKY